MHTSFNYTTYNLHTSILHLNLPLWLLSFAHFSRPAPNSSDESAARPYVEAVNKTTGKNRPKHKLTSAVRNTVNETDCWEQALKEVYHFFMIIFLDLKLAIPITVYEKYEINDF